ncbi:alpha/beta fold hydrolase [Allosaccharopolyspora coralli]|uniref:Alpha/beta fold hydrolase n=1 Tax=Allosaccharopolyspora coralli TaxID=2665642 RepID=A0A5Q3QC09_9PSEU|nr:alpha/beta fold hydrolase [Allosaccharopolyspora coralli]
MERILGSRLHWWSYGHGDDTGRGDGVADDQAAPAVVMVHGLRGTHHGLEPIVEHLPGRRIVIPDLPGFGMSTPMSGAHDVDGYAAAVTALIDVLGSRPVVLLGHSFGSMVAARVAARSPHLVDRLVLVNPIATPALQGPRAVLSRLTSAYYAIGKALPRRAARPWLSHRWVVAATSRAMTRTRDPRIRRFVHDNHLLYFSRFHSPALLSETFEASVSGTVVDDAPSITVPTLLVAGETDEIAPVAGQRALAGTVADARLVVVPRVGHLIHYETPAVAAHEIDAFLAATPETHR